MVTIITPVFNAQQYLDDCIQSVLAQNYSDWELNLVNDGSVDFSKDIILSYTDPRIRYFEQKKSGVSAARNIGLKNMRGDFFCFLDADDVFPSSSLSARIKIFNENPEIDFLDGIVLRMNASLNRIIYEQKPRLKGNPLVDLVHLTGKSFSGLTWMIRKNSNIQYKFRTEISHGEDLLFFMKLARSGGNYSFVETPVLYYRDTVGSAMKNIKQLENGYRFIENEIKCWHELSLRDKLIFKYRWRKFMALDYSKRGQIKELLGLLR